MAAAAIRVVVVIAAISAGCSRNAGNRGTADVGDGLTSLGTGDSTTLGTEDRLDVAAASSSGPPDDDCVGIAQGVDEVRSSDIIIVIDNSSSMGEEAAGVQANLNAFSAQIFDAAIDSRVVLVSSYPGEGTQGVCIDPPLGSGGCPTMDDNPPAFTHVLRDVSSNGALIYMMMSVDEWMPVLRPESSKHVVVVTDDCSDLDPMEFHDGFVALGPGYEGYRFHALIDQQGCGECNGAGYAALAVLTDGLVADVCSQDFAAIFTELSTEVVQTTLLPCSWAIPDPPDGAAIDPAQVNVRFEDAAGFELKVGAVDDAAGCANVDHGWYYDDPAAPTRISVCPQTCDLIQAAEVVSVQIVFGCATTPAQPQE